MTPVSADQYDILSRDLRDAVSRAISAWADGRGLTGQSFDEDGFYGLLGHRPADVASCALLGGLGVFVDGGS